MFNSNCASVPLVASIDGNGNSGNGAWGDGGWWVLIILFALIFGWGGNGWGNNGGGMGSTAAAYTDSAIQRGFDTQTVVSKLDGISNGLCDGFYAQNTTMLQGFNGLQNTVSNGFHGVDNAICNLGYQTQQGFNTTNVALMQGQNALQTQLADCCCTTQRAIDGVNYNMSTNTCALQNTMNNNTRDIIDNQNAGFRSILDYLCQDKISTLQAENQSLKFAASQTAQNQFITQVGSDIVNRLQPVPVPAFPASNLYAYGNGSGCGCNSCC